MSISKESVVESMKQPNVVVLNVLPREEFEKLHIQGSRNLPLTPDYGAFVQEVEKQYGKGRQFIIYGSNILSRAAIDASEVLRKRGFKAEVYLSGMREWSAAGFPMEGTSALKKVVLP
jgi:rhodanese-related sulfurtransferase